MPTLSCLYKVPLCILNRVKVTGQEYPIHLHMKNAKIWPVRILKLRLDIVTFAAHHKVLELIIITVLKQKLYYKAGAIYALGKR